MSAVISPRMPAAATTTSARRTSAARSRVPVWQSVTVAFSLRRVSSRPERPADGDAAADHGDPGAVQLDAVAPAQLDDPARGARQRAGLAEHQPAQADRVQAVGVLGRVDALQRGAGVQPAGSGSCTMKPVQAGSAFSSSMTALDVGLGGVGRQLPLQRGDADLGAVAVLAAHVGVRARVVADQQRAQPGADPGGLQLLDAAR